MSKITIIIFFFLGKEVVFVGLLSQEHLKAQSGALIFVVVFGQLASFILIQILKVILNLDKMRKTACMVT